jgi:hypothetical protein
MQKNPDEVTRGARTRRGTAGFDPRGEGSVFLEQIIFFDLLVVLVGNLVFSLRTKSETKSVTTNTAFALIVRIYL